VCVRSVTCEHLNQNLARW